MLGLLERQTRLTLNQKKIVFAAIVGDMLDFFDYYLIGFVLAFIVGPWHLTYGQSAIVLLSSGVGAIPGAMFWGWMADKIGRRKVFIYTILNFSIATGVLALTPDDRGWIFLTFFRFFVGFGVAGLYTVDLPLVQEFVPSSKRGKVGGLVTACLPLGTTLGAFIGGYFAPHIGWRGVFIVGLLPALLTLLVRAWVPESPRWLLRMGRVEEARKSLAWALMIDPATIKLPDTIPEPPKVRFSELFQHPRSLVLTWLTSLGSQTAGYGIGLWAPTLFVLLMAIKPAEASKLMMTVGFVGLFGRLAFSYMSDIVGRKALGILMGFSAFAVVALGGYYYSATIFGLSVFWLMVNAQSFIGSGGYAIVGPYSAEVWPAHLRASGMGSAYGFGSIGKIVGPLGLALIVGSSDVVSPKATIDAIQPAMLYLASWYLLTGITFFFIGLEVKGRSIEQIDADLTAQSTARRPVPAAASD
ncbi:MAG TPA: MFS transporter [Stellaceae bacterium]|jgi:putative MFS transporter|nr:MFS transporter [Stellaceae bacterium]